MTIPSQVSQEHIILTVAMLVSLILQNTRGGSKREKGTTQLIMTTPSLAAPNETKIFFIYV